MKKEFIILLILIAGICLYLFIYNPDKTNYSLPDLPEISKDKISRIEIGKPDSLLILKQKDHKWWINSENYPADPDKINQLTDLIEKIKLTALVSESENFTRYDLDPDKKITIKVMYGENVRLNFDIGKKVPSFQHTFVRLDKDKRVYHANGNFKDKFNWTIDDLRDKKVTSFNRSKINKIILGNKEKKITLLHKEVPVKPDLNEKDGEKKSDKKEFIWETEDGQKYDTFKIERLITSLDGLQCAGFIYDKKKEDYKKPEYTIIIQTEKEHKLSIFSKIDEQSSDYPLISSDIDYPFSLSKYLAEEIMPDLETLKK